VEVEEFPARYLAALAGMDPQSPAFEPVAGWAYQGKLFATNLRPGQL
jgi:hypothetical protein